MPHFRAALVLCALLAAAPPPASARESTPAALQQRRLDVAKARLEKLRDDPRRRRFRDAWESIIRELEGALRAAPRGPRAAEASLWLARAREELWCVSRSRRDAQTAIAAYRKVDEGWPGSAEAARALLRAAQLAPRAGQTVAAASAARRLAAGYPRSAEARALAPAARRAPAGKRTPAPPKEASAVSSAPPRTASSDRVEEESGDDEDDSDTQPVAAPVAASARPAASNARRGSSPLGAGSDEAIAAAKASAAAALSIARESATAALAAAKEKESSNPAGAATETSAARGGAADSDAAPVPRGLGPRSRSRRPRASTESAEDVGAKARQIGADVTAEASKLVSKVIEAARGEGRDDDLPPEPEAPEPIQGITSKAAVPPSGEGHGRSTRARELRSAALSSKGGSVGIQLGLKVRRVVVDPGHGGRDTGAVGPHGVREKDVALAIARQLAARLRALGLTVVLTRKDDRYVSLDERTRIANEAKADLFVSVHCNAARRSRLAGVETWTLNVASDRYSARLASFENAGAERTVSDLRLILADLATRANTNDARDLAQSVQSSLVRNLRARGNKVQDHGVKHALFYVLLGAKMPAILVETGFISNPAEESRLRSGKYQETTADAIARGVRDFVDGRRRLARAF